MRRATQRGPGEDRGWGDASTGLGMPRTAGALRSWQRGLEHVRPQSFWNERTLVTPWFWTCGLHNCEGIYSVVIRHPVAALCYRNPKKRIYCLFKILFKKFPHSKVDSILVKPKNLWNPTHVWNCLTTTTIKTHNSATHTSKPNSPCYAPQLASPWHPTLGV